MTNVQFGVQYNGVSMSAVIGPLEFARRMESLGYCSYFVPELETLPTLDPFVLLAAVAQHTERMRLGTGVAVLPFRTPYQMAKIATSIDVLSGGRMVLGLGSGGVFNDDFGVEGVRPEDRRAITDERLELVRRLLSEERVTHSGAFHRMEDMALEPRSVQQPHLPIWTGAMWNGRFSKRMLERTARWADGFHPHGMTPRGYAEGKAAIEEMAAGLGRDPSRLEWSCNMYLCMGPSARGGHAGGAAVHAAALRRRRVGAGPGHAAAGHTCGLHRAHRGVCRGRRGPLRHQRAMRPGGAVGDVRGVYVGGDGAVWGVGAALCEVTVVGIVT